MLSSHKLPRTTKHSIIAIRLVVKHNDWTIRNFTLYLSKFYYLQLHHADTSIIKLKCNLVNNITCRAIHEDITNTLTWSELKTKSSTFCTNKSLLKDKHELIHYFS